MKLVILLAALAAVAQSEERIVGGKDANGPNPNLANLRYLGIVFCGASVLNNNWLLTAAHCQRTKDMLEITAGDYDITVKESSEQTAKVEKLIPHEQYDCTNFENDIMLIQLSTPFVYNQYVQPVVLPTTTRDVAPVGTKCTVCGWGRTNSEEELVPKFPDKLQCVDALLVMSMQKCQDLYDDEDEGITPGMMCIGVLAGGKDPCENDSGGPAICGGKQYGIVSWRVSCGEEDEPAVYADVAYYRDWISTHANL